MEEHAWIIDSLIQFLSGPVWNKPIASFIERKSTIFEPDMTQETADHHKIHQQYRNLVDSLLGGFVEEMHISPSQFQQAVTDDNAGASTLARFQPATLLEQVWAASDFITFSRLMGLRNLELQLQALDSIRNRGDAPLALEVDPDEQNASGIPGEQRLLEHVLRRSMEEVSIVERMKKINRLSLTETTTAPSQSTQENKEEESSKNLVESPCSHSKTDDRRETSSDVVSNKMEHVAVPNVAPNEERMLLRRDKPKSAKGAGKLTGTMRPADMHTTSIILTQDEIRKRKEHLCRQRDKLLQAKGRTVNRQPVVTCEMVCDTHPPPVASNTSSGDEHEREQANPSEQALLQLRRALVTRLKSEIITNK